MPYELSRETGRYLGASSNDCASIASIRCALNGCDTMLFENVVVTINDGQVTLEGWVIGEGEDLRAMVIAEAVMGSGSVFNRVIVRYPDE